MVPGKAVKNMGLYYTVFTNRMTNYLELREYLGCGTFSTKFKKVLAKLQ